MAYARKVAVKKLKLKTFGDMAAQLWKTFSAMASTCKRIDVVFDVYEAGSIIDFERLRRSTVDPIEVSINRSDTPLPIDIDRSWQDSVKASVMFIIDPLVGPLGHNKLESSQAKKKNKLLRGGEREEEKFQQFNEIRDREVWKLDVKEIQDGC
ncbi:hypothetical protein GQR58_027289 [Nymphon striatum]|nr:hypothetical protein GQR58_027289 [Nymphon striatum]